MNQTLLSLQSPFKLYDLCIKHIIEHLNLMFNEKPSIWNDSYVLNDAFKLIPSINESLLAEYSNYFENKLRKSYLLQCFKLNLQEITRESNDDFNGLIKYYSFLMSICKNSKINKLQYKECTKLSNKTKVSKSTYYFPISSKLHLNDVDLNDILKRQFNNLQYIDLCICELTNRSLYLLNKSKETLKYLSLSNYCSTKKSDLFLNETSSLEGNAGCTTSNCSSKKRTYEQEESTSDTSERASDLVRSNINKLKTQLEKSLKKLREKRQKVIQSIDDDDDDQQGEEENMKILNGNDNFDIDEDEMPFLNYKSSFSYYELQLPQIQYLTLKNLNDSITEDQLNGILSKLINIKYLDLTNTCSSIKLNCNLTILSETLTYFIYSNNSPTSLKTNIDFICRLKNLRQLDLSHFKEMTEPSQIQIYLNASYLLAKLVYCLKNLVWLDISGTNLSGPQLFNKQDEMKYIMEKFKQDDKELIDVDSLDGFLPNEDAKIIGMMFMRQKSLEFLGCFHCDDTCGQRESINLLAKRIASDTDIKYLLNSLIHYQEKEYFSLLVINQMFEIIRDDELEQKDKLFSANLIMTIMNKYLNNSRLQISGSACLFYVLKNSKDNSSQLPHHFLRRLIETIVNSIEEHIDQTAMKRNCVLIMCRLNLPEDIIFISERLIRVLLKIINDYIQVETNRVSDEQANRPLTSPESFVIRTSMHLLNILACSTNINGEQKNQFGQIAIPCIMKLIKLKINKKEIDDILEVTWSFLWNITDETPFNCKIFLDNCNGMSIFLDCIKFKSEIVRNIMGLLGNIAECKEFRSHLVTREYVNTYRMLLNNLKDGIEIAYNSAGVLVHILSDGLDAYLDHISIEDRDDIIAELEKSIDSWDIKFERNINYRSFLPIFSLIKQNNSTQICQRWACWALANLTTVYPDNYCSLFTKENGVELLEKEVIQNEQINETIKKYAQITLDNVKNYFSSGKSNNIEQQ